MSHAPRFLVLSLSALLTASTALAGSPARWFNEGWDSWLNQTSGDVITSGNQIRLLVDGPEYYPVRLELIRRAKRTIDMQTYLWCDDVAGLQVAEELAAAARRGVRVRVIGDPYNPYKHERSLKAMHDAGIPVLIYNPAYWGFYDFNRRVHEKIMIVDGEEFLVGGANMCSEYLYDTPEKPIWHDLELNARGPVAARAQARWDATWNWMAQQAQSALDGRGTSTTEALLYRSYEGYKYPVFTQPTESDGSVQGEDFGLLLIQQPYWHDGMGKRFARLFAELTRLARKRLVVYEPYFVPNSEFENALHAAARRGVEVYVMTNSKETNDMAWIPAAGAFNHYTPALDSGIHVYEITDQTLHAKAVMVDDRFLTVGSHNFTHRSFRSNGEGNLMTNSRQAIEPFEKMFQRDLGRFRRVTPEMLVEGKKGIRNSIKLIIGRLLEKLF